MQLNIICYIFIIMMFSLAVSPGIADERRASYKDENIRKGSIYPPFPDVWGYELPWYENKMRALVMSVHESPSGDYAITYSPCKGCDRVGFYFFSGKEVNKKYLDLYFKQHISGSTAMRTEIKFDREMSWKIEYKCLFKECCPDISRYPLTKYNPNRTKEQLSVVYFSEDPYKTYYDQPPDSCIDKGLWQRFGEKFYLQQVFMTRPYFIPLRDGTFLLYDDLGNFVIRLDKNFNSKSNLLNKSIFIVDTSDIEAIENGLIKLGIFNRQTYDNAVVSYIKALKVERQGKRQLENR